MKRDPLMPWYIGAGFLLALDVIFFYTLTTVEHGIPGPLILGIMIVLPGLYLFLMYLAFRSQD